MSDQLTTTAEPKTSHARDFGRPGFWVKFVLMLIINAFGVYGILASWGQDQYGVMITLIIALIVADWVYFSKRAIPAKYLYPGLFFLLVFQVYVMAHTAFVAFTNYGTGHNDVKSSAIRQIQLTNDIELPNSPTYQLTIIEQGGELGFAVVQNGEVMVGTADKPLHAVDGTATDTKVTEVAGADIIAGAEIAARQTEIFDLRVPLSDDPADGMLRTKNGSTAVVSVPMLTYDEATDTFTNPEGVVYSADESKGLFVAPDGSSLKPGWYVSVGWTNFTTMFTDSRLAGPFFKIMLWTFAFAILSVLTTFALGLFLAIVYNDARVKGRRIYRALFILPYAFPAFLSALVWRGLFNERFGFINAELLGGANLHWFTDGNMAKLTILLVNLWLGFPYMFLICTGALQSIPGELTEAGIMDGASTFRRFRSITFPLLLVSVAPLLIASFAFNFNNFTLIYMVTGGGPNYPGLPYLIGDTDILISAVYAIAIESGQRQYGLASAVSIIIFVVVGVISWLGFRQTRKLEEIM